MSDYYCLVVLRREKHFRVNTQVHRFIKCSDSALLARLVHKNDCGNDVAFSRLGIQFRN